jgi:8-oxo-dGTP pyrophosphatase MutT (NUDIX family)
VKLDQLFFYIQRYYMTHLISKLPERVGAFIIRKNKVDRYELLLFRHPDCREAPIQLPGGGIDPEETIEAALHREIYEESGLTNLTLLRKVGTSQRCWLDTHHIAYRHYFLLEAPSTTPNGWEHIVHGDGFDAGLRFTYFWQRPTIEFTLAGGAQAFLNRYHLPELYD